MTESERIIHDRLDTIEEALKILLVNDVIKDTETLAEQSKKRSVRKDTKKEKEYQQKIEELQGTLQSKDDKINTLQKQLKTKEERVSSLQNQLETQKKRVQTLQQLSESKDRTIQIKEERIQVLQKQIANYEAATQNPEAYRLIGKKWNIVSGTAQELVFDAYESVNGTPVRLNKRSTGLNQLFMIEHHSDNYFIIRNQGTGKVIDLNDGKIYINGKIQLWDFNGTDAQLWKLEYIQNNSFLICSKLNEDYCLGVYLNGRNMVVLCEKYDSAYQKEFCFADVQKVSAEETRNIRYAIVVGQQVKIRPECTQCYDINMMQCNISKFGHNALREIYTIRDQDNKNKRCLLYVKNGFGQRFQFWVDENMVEPC